MPNFEATAIITDPAICVQPGPLGGVRVLWRGVGATLAKDVPYAVLFWSALEPARAAMLPPGGEGAAPPSTSALLAANAAAGMAAGGLAAAITTPLDVAKVRACLRNRRYGFGIRLHERGVLVTCAWSDFVGANASVSGTSFAGQAC